jgi:hypothetical protein
MVTHGYLVYKYQGVYYIFYNHSDSYPEHLGSEIVKTIRQVVSENKLHEYKNKLRYIPFRDEASDGGEMNLYEGSNSLYSYECYSYYTSTEEPGNEWVYIIDLDMDKFIITDYNSNRYVFNLKNIRDDWMDIVRNNDMGYEDPDEKEDEDIEEDVEICESDTEEDIGLKIKILQANVKIYKLKLQLNKKHI